jgi:hypothetical protein
MDATREERSGDSQQSISVLVYDSDEKPWGCHYDNLPER